MIQRNSLLDENDPKARELGRREDIKKEVMQTIRLLWWG